MSKEKTSSKIKEVVAPLATKTITQLDCRAVRTGIKKGMTAEQFCVEYGCSQIQLEGKIRLLYIHEADDILAQIKDNVKSKKGGGNRKPHKRISAGPMMSPLQAAEIAVEKETDGIPSDLAGLQGAIIEYGRFDALFLAEKAKAEEDRKNAGEEIKILESEILRINYELQKITKELEEEKSKKASASKKIDKFLTLHIAAQQHIDMLQNAINEALRPTMYVFEDGNIELEHKEGAEKTDISFDGSNELVSRLYELEDAQTLTVKDIKTVARVICALKNLGREATLVFENKKLEKAYQKLEVVLS